MVRRHESETSLKRDRSDAHDARITGRRPYGHLPIRTTTDALVVGGRALAHRNAGSAAQDGPTASATERCLGATGTERHPRLARAESRSSRNTASSPRSRGPAVPQAGPPQDP